MQYHHLDPHQLPFGDWVAVVDPDRVPSGDLEMQRARRVGALLIVVMLSIMVDLVSGYGRCWLPPLLFTLPRSKKPTETLPPWVMCPQLSSRPYEAV
uniref:Uncharacterized protein n=1 Tax=Physcomitrium patens TaxID=3218 RepID=A0A2K1JMS3_PHYPA|nr:hypothetical protein PHYPA_017660 [Physcomitrium patens]